MTIALTLVLLATWLLVSVIMVAIWSYWRAAEKAEEELQRRMEYDLETLRAVKVSGRPRLTVIAGGRS